ncbi:MAG: hypothetical protein J5742_04510 [Alphaproteobacteria bacterium]|nr:hypothetical protein [Alphaproteobacteria bacterium]
MKKILLTSILAIVTGITVANATDGDKKVTSKNYVDTAVATRQEKITAGTSGSVVTYNGTQNGQTQFSEHAILDAENDFDNDGNVSDGHEDDLVTVDGVYNMLDSEFNNRDSHLESTRVVQTTCSNPPDCTLWSMEDVVVHKLECTAAADCASKVCLAGSTRDCVGGMCKCVMAE